jgi:peptidoglycan/LPS O-acetylase OafA/YrhL
MPHADLSALTNATRRLPGLDLLRAIAIVWVMLFHSYIIDGWHEPFSALENVGWMGVDLFFVLSGYLIGYQLLKPLCEGRPLSLGSFYLRRAFRILPAYVAVLALYFLWPAFREKPGIQPLWQFLTFTVNLTIDTDHNLAFSHVWSLCVEEHFYLVFPCLAWWLTRRPSLAKFLGVFAVVLVGGIALRGWVWMHWLAPVIHQDAFNARFLEDIYYPTWSRLDGLLAGVVLATIRACRPRWWTQLQQRANAALLAGCVVLGVAMVLFRERAGLLASVIGYPVMSLAFALMVLAGTSPLGWLSRMRVPGAGWLALTSYSLYLSHKAMLHLVDGEIGTMLAGHVAVAFLVYACAVLLAGALLHYAIEQPFLRLREKLARHLVSRETHLAGVEPAATPDL